MTGFDDNRNSGIKMRNLKSPWGSE